METFDEMQHEITQQACKTLACYRRRLRDHSMTWEDQENLADVLEWVEECLVIPSDEPVVSKMSLLARASSWLGMLLVSASTWL